MEVLILFTMIVGLMLLGVPIAVSLGFSSIVFLLVLSDSSLASIAQTFFQAMAGHYTLLAIPFFVLASSFMSFISRLAKRSYGLLQPSFCYLQEKDRSGQLSAQTLVPEVNIKPQ